MAKKFSLFFLLVLLMCLLSFAKFQRNINMYVRVLASDEKSSTYGGFSVLSSSSGKGGSSSTVSTKIDVKLENVPYYYQNDDSNERSNTYCGLASAMMVRNKGSKSSSYYYSNISQAQVNSYMKSIDNALRGSNAPYYFDSLSQGENIDITRYGLLYYDVNLDNNSWRDDSQSRNTLFSKTKGVINDLYTSRDVHGLLPWQGYVNRAFINVSTPSSAEDAIWNHIKSNKEPAVVIMDINRTPQLNSGVPIGGMTKSPALHYEVIVGIYQESSNSDRYFYVFDPWRKNAKATNKFLKYKASDYVNAMAINSSVRPNWLYEYASKNHGGNWHDDGCYYMLINN